MKPILRLFLLFVPCALLYGRLPPEAVLPIERFEVGWPQEKWVKVKDASDRLQRIIEYVREGDNLKTWREIITDQAVVARFSDARSAVDSHLQGLRRRFDSFGSTIISETPREVVYEWWQNDQRGYGPEHVVGVVLWRPFSVTFFTYARKGPRLSEGDRALWIKRVSEAKYR